MTLGPSLPRALCPHCLEEGTPSPDQERRIRGLHTPLTATIRFTCTNKHAWRSPREDAELMGAFLDRQPS